MDLNEFLKKSYILGGHCPECDGFYFTEVIQRSPLLIHRRCLKCGHIEDITKKVKDIDGIKQKVTPVYSTGTRRPIAWVIDPIPSTTGKLDRNAFGGRDSLKSYEDLLRDMIL